MKKSRELQMQVNDALSCRGSCQGCVLAPSERKTSSPDMSADVLALAASRIEEYAAQAGPVERVNVIFGIGDHVLYGADYLAKLHGIGSRAVLAGRPSDPERSVVFFTTSLVGRRQDVMGVLSGARKSMSGPVRLVPQVVLDGRIMEAAKFGPTWKDMVAGARDLFGKVDLATNLSGDAVRQMTPEQLLAFVRANGFDEVSVTWSPTLHNARQTVAEHEAVCEWLLELDDLLEDAPEIQTTYRPVVAKMLSSIAAREDGAVPEMADTVSETLHETVTKAFDIEPDGALCPKFEAVGDVNHAPRHGLPGAGNIADAPIADLLASAMPSIRARILSTHARGACADCDVANVCAGTGFHVATHVARRTSTGSEKGCPHLARRIIKRIEERWKRGDATVSGF